MPELSVRMLDRLGVTDKPTRADLAWKEDGVGRIQHGDPLVPRIDEEVFLAALVPVPGLAATSAPVPAVPATPAPTPATDEGLIGFAEFGRAKLVAARILTAERVSGADKLLRLEIDCGEAEPRQIVAGIALDHAPESLPGQMICVVRNLEPAKIRGIVSRGMLLAAKGPGGLTLVNPGDVPPGTPIG